MESKALNILIQAIIIAVEKRIPEFLANAEDRNNNNSNCAICIVDAAGAVYGKMFGADKIRLRHSYRIAWIKASQVWITGLRTGEFETRVYAGKIDEHDFGISRPDFIGWEGGQPIVVDGQTKLSVGFSGFRGTSDLEIVQKAVADVKGKK
ncbi:MAG TPA: heme-binding protein [Verrucomicrobiae bacterium]|jgi:glc operon protein GlcG